MGLHPGLVNGTNKNIIFSTKIRLHSLEVFSNYMIIVPQILIQNDHRCSINSNNDYHCDDEFPVPNWSETISLFLYSDVTRYDREEVYKPTSTSSTGDRISWGRGDNTQRGDSGKIFIRDFADVGRNIKKGVVWTQPYKRPRQSYDFLKGFYGIYVQSYSYRMYVDEDAVDITSVNPATQPDYEMAFIQITKINTNGEEISRNRRSGPSTDDVYNLNKTYSFHTKGSSKNLVTRLTFHQNNGYQWYDRFVFETPKFDIGKDLTVILLPIPRFPVHLFSMEVISDS
ncbi:hypothetical protein ACTFIW_009297 [Dictyostelium discoideum]